jgi:hypothetical protein
MYSFFVHKRIISAVKRVEFVSDRMSYIILRGRWCHIIVVNVHAPTEDKTDVKESFYEELEIPHENSVRRLQCQSRQGRPFKPAIGNESLHETSNDNGVGLINLATSKNLRVKSTMFQIATSKNIFGRLQMGKPNQIDHILVDSRRHGMYLMFDHTGQQIVTLALSGGGKR